MYFETQHRNGIGELHHIFGSKHKVKVLKEAGIDKCGEWLVIMIPRTVHIDIKSHGFEYERGVFLAQQREYFNFYHKESPMPKEVIRYMELIKNKQELIREL